MSEHKQGCPALGGYGTADRQCICGAEKPLREDMDARRWAKEFLATNPSVDEGAAIGWFANAIMCGYDEAMRRTLLNRLEECALSDGGIRWVNDFAVALTIRKLVEQRDELLRRLTPPAAHDEPK